MNYKTNCNCVPKAKGLLKYSDDVQNYVRESIENNVDIKEISNNTGISKSTLTGWIKKGQI